MSANHRPLRTLLMRSALERLLGAAVLLALLWLLVFWALGEVA
ncbi:hypothetical protein [Crenobacter intestini]|nr:hypothetical protein [Crenobacter intestini]